MNVNPEELYGPQHELITRMIAACDSLTDEQVEAMAEAFAERRQMVDEAAWRAAEYVSPERVKQAGKAAWDLKVSMKSTGFDRDFNVMRLAATAANDAGVAVSTLDLIGTDGYFKWDYDKLMYPWRVGAGDPS